MPTSSIYIIRSSLTDKVYIGSTKNSLCRRFTGHKDKYIKWAFCPLERYYSSFKIMEFGDARIELLESFNHNTIEELRSKEAYWIRLFGPLAVNIQIPGRTRLEYLIDKKRAIMNYISRMSQSSQGSEQ